MEVLPDTAGHVRNLDAPMVGRDKDLRILRGALDRVVDERTSHLLGPAGVGKSRLVREFLLGASAARLLRGRCLSYGEGITYYALDGVDDAATIAGALGGVLGWAEPSGAEDTTWAARKLFEHLGRAQPLVIVIDDLHWAEPLQLDLVEHLADRTRDAPVLLLMVARPELLELRPAWGGGKMNATTILLEPLPGDVATELLDNLLGSNDLPADARDRILAAADGNPLFVEETVGMLIDDGLLRFDGHTWRAAQDLADLTVPPTISLLLAARLDRPDAEERAVIERGAVEGKVFHVGAVTSLVPEPLRAQVRPRLLTLARKELIRPDRAKFAGEDAFRFRHLLIRDAAYQAMPKEQRAGLHERFAEWLEGAAGEQSADHVEILGHHLEQARRYRRELGMDDETTAALGNRASVALRTSADRSSIRGDLVTASHQSERAAEMATGPEHDLTRAAFAEILDERNQYTEAASVAEELGSASDELIRIRAELVRLSATAWTDPTMRRAESLARLEELSRDAERVGSQELADRCELAKGLMLFFGGHSEAFREIALRLLPRVHAMRFPDRRSVGFGIVASLTWGPVPVDEAVDTPAQVEWIHEGSLFGRIGAARWRVVLSAMADDAGRASMPRSSSSTGSSESSAMTTLDT